MPRLRFLIFLVLLPILTRAGFIDSGPVLLTQPDSVTTFTARMVGDEYDFKIVTTGEDIDSGYVIVVNRWNWYMYAVLDRNGDYVASNDTVGFQAPPDTSFELERSSVTILRIQNTRDSVRALQIGSMRAYASAARSRMALTVTADTIDVGVLLVDYPDIPAPTTVTRPYGATPVDIDSMLGAHGNGWRGLGHHWNNDTTFGSLAQFFSEASLGKVYFRVHTLNQINPATGAYVWLTMPQPSCFYDETGPFFGRPERAAFFRADSLGLWDGQDDHYEKLLFIQTFRSLPNATQLVFGVQGLPGSTKNLTGPWIQGWGFSGTLPDAFGLTHIGAYCHEMSHAAFGLPDEYSTTPNGHGFDIMASEGYRNGPTIASCPAFMNVFDRIELGWIVPSTLSIGATNITGSYVAPVVYMDHLNAENWYHYSFDGDTTYYTAIELKTRQGFDKYIPYIGASNRFLFWPTGVSNLNRYLKPGMPVYRPTTGPTVDTFAIGTFEARNIVDSGTSGSFVTTSLVGTFVTTTASNVTQTSAVLNGAVNTGNLPTVVSFYYGTVPNALTDTVVAIGSPISSSSLTNVSQSLSGLNSNTQYFFQLHAYNSNGAFLGAQLSFTTLPQAVPPAVSTGGANSILQTSASLNGTVHPGYAQTTVRFLWGSTSNVYNDSALASQSPLVSNLPATAVSAVVGNLITGQTYYYRIRAYNSAGATAGAESTFTTLSTPPPSVAVSAPGSIGYTGASLAGVVNANGYPTVVRFLWGVTAGIYTDSATATQSPVGGSSNTPVSLSVYGLQEGTTYYYRLRGYSAGGAVQSVLEQAFTTLTTQWVTTGAATLITPTGVRLNGVVIPPLAIGPTYVSFWYGVSTGSLSDTLVAQESPLTGNYAHTVSANIATLQPGTTYYFRVKAYQLGTPFQTSQGTILSFTTPAGVPVSTIAPATLVTSTSATLHGTVDSRGASTTVRFAWGLNQLALSDTSYAVENPVTSPGAVSLPINSLAFARTYYYRILASNSGGSGMSTQTLFTTDSIAPTVVTSNPTTVTTSSAVTHGEVNPGGASTTIRVVYGTASDTYSDSAVIGVYSGVTTTSFSRLLGTLSSSTTYYYRMRGYNSKGAGQGVEMSFTTGAVPPDVATGAASNITSTTARISGTVNANGSLTVLRFVWGVSSGIYTDSVNATPSSTSGDGVAVVADLTGLTAGVRYYYQLRGYSVGGDAIGAERDLTTLAIPPEIKLQSVSLVTATSAVLQATVVTNGLSTRVWFVYTRSLGPIAIRDSIFTDITARNGDVSVTGTPTNLLQNTVYTYRPRAENIAGSTTSTVVTTFQTGVIVSGGVNGQIVITK